MNQSENPYSVDSLIERVRSLEKQLFSQKPKNFSDEIDKIAEALSKAQGMMGPAKKATDGQPGRPKHANLDDVIDALKEPLSKNGIAFTQVGELNEDRSANIETRLFHTSGQWIRSFFYLPSLAHFGGSDQKWSACKTYIKKNALKSIVGMGQDDDFDIEMANTYQQPQKLAPMSREPQKQQVQQKKSDPTNHISHQVKNVITDIMPKETELISGDQISILNAEFKGHYEVEKTVLSGLSISSVDEVPRHRFEAVLNRVRKIKEDLKTANVKPNIP